LFRVMLCQNDVKGVWAGPGMYAFHRPTAEDSFRRYTENAEAYRPYLKVRYHRLKATPEALRKSRHYSQRARSQVDTTCPLAYAGIMKTFTISALKKLPPN
jgi:hypothetical protein